MIVTAMQNRGGSGKSSTVAALAQAAAMDGVTPLVVDMDGQGNVTQFLDGPQLGTTRATTYSLLTGAMPAEACIMTTPQGVDIIPASGDLNTLTTKPGSSRRLAEALRPVEARYPLILIDTPPVLGEAVYNALYAADGLLIPLTCDLTSLNGLLNIVQVARQMQATVNPRLRIFGTFISQYDGRAVIRRQIKEQAEATAAALSIPFLGVIRSGVSVLEAQATRRSLFKYAPKSKPANDFLNLYKSLKNDFESSTTN